MWYLDAKGKGRNFRDGASWQWVIRGGGRLFDGQSGFVEGTAEVFTLSLVHTACFFSPFHHHKRDERSSTFFLEDDA